MNKKIVFDAYAIMTLLEDEPDSETVMDIILDEQKEIFISAINLGEVYYILLRRNGRSAAEHVVQNIFLEENIHVVEAKWYGVKNAAEIKSQGGLSYADAFALSLAKELQAPLVTGDPEIQAVADKTGVDIIWLS